MNYIRAVERDFVMKSGDIVYIRQSKRSQIKKEYMSYLMEAVRDEREESREIREKVCV
jgi:ribosomal protein L19